MPSLDAICRERVAGIDVHKENLVCCVCFLGDENKYIYEHDTFKSTQDGLCDLIKWFKERNMELVLMESTGVLWKAPYLALEEAKFDIALVNARDMKRWEARKTDATDAECLADAARIGAFARSFIPSKEFRDLRIVSRERSRLVDDLHRAKNRVHKVLLDAGCRISLVCSDIWGATGKKIVAGLMEGLTPQEILTKLGKCKLKKSKKDICECIAGRLSSTHKFTLRGLLDDVEYLEKRIAEQEAYIFQRLEEVGQSKNVDRLQTIPGVSKIASAQIIIETGGILSAFRSVKAFASWLGLCSGNHESAGKRSSGHCGNGNKYLRRILCECANAASRTKETTLRSKCDALKARRGSKKATVAIAHKIARIIYAIMKKDELYIDPKIDYSNTNKKRNQRFIKQLVKLNMRVVNNITGEPVNLRSLSDQL